MMSQPSESITVRSYALVSPCLGIFIFVPTFFSSRDYVIILVSGSSSFILAVPKREVLRVRYLLLRPLITNPLIAN